MIQGHDTVFLTHDIEEHGLKQGDFGTVVHCYADLISGEYVAFEVEFVNVVGRTVALLMLSRDEIKPVENNMDVKPSNALTLAGNAGNLRTSNTLTVIFIGLAPHVIESVTSAIHLRWPDVYPMIATTAREGLELVKRESPDLVLIHPDFNDKILAEAIKEIRSLTGAPLMVLGKWGDQMGVVTALESGACDYVRLPCDLTEIMVRVWAVLRRSGNRN